LKSSAVPQAKSLYFIKQQYEWVDVEVLEYCADVHRFLIRYLHNNETKKVIRLNLIFNSEDINQFNTRLNVAKNIMAKAQNDQRFMDFILTIPNESVSHLGKDIIHRINNKIFKNIKNY
jgi:hypothetical protein